MPASSHVALPLRLLVGFSAGSASDDLVRLIAPELARHLGQRVSVELMPGDLGARAAAATIASPPDGGTLLVATFGTHAINPNLRPDLGYDPLRDFAPVCLATRAPLVLGVRPSLPADTVPGLISLAGRTRLTYGSSAVGSAPHLAGGLFGRLAGIAMEHRPYADTRVLYEDLLAERLDLSFNNATGMLPLVREGRLRALAVTTAGRSAALPDVPTLAEAGLAGYALSNWLGFVAPPGTADAMAEAQGQAIGAALRSASVKRALVANGVEIVAGTPCEFAVHVADELGRWSWLRP